VTGTEKLRLRLPVFPFESGQLVHADRAPLERLFTIHRLNAEQLAAARAAIEAARAGEYGRKAAA
jgi:hypothetical protein